MELDTPTVSRNYERLYELAHGGLGVVDLVIHRGVAFERLYAMKRLHPLHREDATIRAMFLEEARIAGLLRHPNVIAVHDYGEDLDGPFLVMDYVEGVSLSTVLKQLTEGEMLPVRLCLELAVQVAKGLHAAHELTSHDGQALGLVHRDVSPQNILIGFDGVVKVIDFGVAKILGVDSLTSTGVIKGKLGYMSPEQLRYEPIDRRSDLFALGVVLFEMLGNRRLYDPRSDSNTPLRILTEPPPDISELRRDIPSSLVELLFDLLSKDRDDRPVDALDVARRLEEISDEVGQDEDDVDLESFLEERYSAHRETLGRRVREAVASLSTDKPEAPSTTRSPDASVDSKQVRPSMPRRRKRRHLRFLGILVALVLVSSALTYFAAHLFERGLWGNDRGMSDGREASDGSVAPSLRSSSLMTSTRLTEHGDASTPTQMDPSGPDAATPGYADDGDVNASGGTRRGRARRPKNRDIRGEGNKQRPGWMSW